MLTDMRRTHSGFLGIEGSARAVLRVLACCLLFLGGCEAQPGAGRELPPPATPYETQTNCDYMCTLFAGDGTSSQKCVTLGYPPHDPSPALFADALYGYCRAGNLAVGSCERFVGKSRDSFGPGSACGSVQTEGFGVYVPPAGTATAVEWKVCSELGGPEPECAHYPAGSPPVQLSRCVFLNVEGGSYNPGKSKVSCYGFYKPRGNVTCKVADCNACAEAEPTTCAKCKSGTFLSSHKECAPCPTEHCSMCSGGGSDGCVLCDAGYTLTSAGACAPCPSDCAECDPAGGCYRCAPGFWLGQDGGCTQCDAGCDFCLSSTECGQCSAGFALNTSGACVACPSGCDVCTEDGATCTSCAASTSYNASTGACESYPDISDLVCSGYRDASGACQECPKGTAENCGVCGANGCTSCAPGYGLVNGECKVCPHQQDGCLECTTTACTRCGEAQYVNDQGGCSDCSEFSGANTCLDCNVHGCTNCMPIGGTTNVTDGICWKCTAVGTPRPGWPACYP